MKLIHYDRNALVGESGATAATLGWCRALATAGADVTLVVDRATARQEGPPEVRCIKVPHLLRRKVRIPRGIDRWIAHADVLVLHAGWRPSNVAIARRARLAAIPYVASTHGIYLRSVLDRGRTTKRIWARLFERAYLQRSLGVHIYFEEEIGGLEQLGVATPTIVAPCGFDPPEGITWEGGGGYLLWLGRFDPYQKGLDLLIEAIASLSPAERPHVRLHGPDRRGGKHEIGQLVRRLRLDKCVSIGAPVYGDEKWHLLRRAEGFVYPSRWEAFGMAPAEAVSIGVPTLVTPYSLGRWLADRDGAIIVETDATSVAAGLRHLLSPRSSEVARKGVEAVRSELSWSATARRWLRHVEELLDHQASQTLSR